MQTLLLTIIRLLLYAEAAKQSSRSSFARSVHLCHRRRHNSAKRKRIYLCLKIIGTGSQNNRGLRAGQNIAVLNLRRMYQTLINQIARVNIGEKQHICIAHDLSALCAFMLGCLRVNRKIQRKGPIYNTAGNFAFLAVFSMICTLSSSVGYVINATSDRNNRWSIPSTSNTQT